MDTTFFVASDLMSVLPEMVLLLAAFLVMGFTFSSQRNPIWFEALSVLGLLGALTLTVFAGQQGPAFSGAIQISAFTILASRIFLLAALLTVLVSRDYLRSMRIRGGEYYILILFSTIGMSLMVKAAELLMLIIGLETMSLSIYVLVGLYRTNSRANESALKYYLMGAVATAVTLFGLAFVFGATGTTRLPAIGAAIGMLKGTHVIMLNFGLALIFAGMAFKVAAFPFQMWVPDVYEGALTSITGFMSTGVKAAAFAALLQIFYNYTGIFSAKWVPVLWVIAVGTMTYGNLLAIAQTNIKRMLAYSSIAHAGYLMVAVTALAASGDPTAIGAILFYLAVYLFMNIAAFAIVAALRKGPNEFLHIEEFRGLAKTHPWLAFALAVVLFSLTGIPVTGGFMVKFYIFSAAMKANLVGLFIIAVLNSVISFWYYQRITIYMYMRTDEAGLVTEPVSPMVNAVIAVCLIFILLMGIFPNWFIPLSSYVLALN